MTAQAVPDYPKISVEIGHGSSMSPKTIFRTELLSPPPHLNLAVHMRLQSKLADALCPETCLTLICAPAGIGKITKADVFHEVGEAIGAPLRSTLQ